MSKDKSEQTISGSEAHSLVQRAYGEIAQQAAAGDLSGVGSCGLAHVVDGHPVPAAELGLSCGTPVAFSELRPGDTALDLGCGAGKDVFLAARAVGARGRVIGVDMTPAMLQLARHNAVMFTRSQGYNNIELREGKIEALPVESDSVDVVISNCVVNLSPDKAQVFREAFRVLKPGGKLVLSDIVLNKPLPPEALADATLYAGCISGALLREEYLGAIRAAGFTSIDVLSDQDYDAAGACCDPVTSSIAGQLAGHAASITLRAVK